MLKATTTRIATFVLVLIPALMAQTAKPLPCATAVGCAAPEPSAVPELGLCLAGIAVGCWLWRRTRKPI